MIAINNHSGFPVELLSIPDPDGQEIPLLVSSQTWLYSDGSAWEPAPEPPPICFADEYFGKPSVYSSVSNEAQTATNKQAIDVVVNGSAYAPRGVPTRTVTVELHIGTISKQVRVVGDRFKTFSGPSAPAEFVLMPLIYERAYGGFDTRRQMFWEQNPAGIGFHGARSQRKDVLTEYPNLEPVQGSLEAQPAGYGIISRGWSPRIGYAGTYDAEWLNHQWPLLPRDFDFRHYQAAPIDQQVASLGTGDRVRMVNFTSDGVWEFAMPSTTLNCWVISDCGKRQTAPCMDTVLIEPDQRRMTMVFRINLAGESSHGRIREVIVGSVSPGYLRARERRKPYFDFRNTHPSDAAVVE